MMKEEKIEVARRNWVRSSKEIGFKIITPYHIMINDKNKKVFAYLPEYGSTNGMLIGLTIPPNFETDKDIFEWAKKKGCFCSFININGSLKYDEGFIKDMLEDWGKFK